MSTNNPNGPGITCRLCGCLNFSSAPICDTCRQKPFASSLHSLEAFSSLVENKPNRSSAPNRSTNNSNTSSSSSSSMMMMMIKPKKKQQEKKAKDKSTRRSGSNSSTLKTTAKRKSSTNGSSTTTTTTTTTAAAATATAKTGTTATAQSKNTKISLKRKRNMDGLTREEKHQHWRELLEKKDGKSSSSLINGTSTTITAPITSNYTSTTNAAMANNLLLNSCTNHTSMTTTTTTSQQQQEVIDLISSDEEEQEATHQPTAVVTPVQSNVVSHVAVATPSTSTEQVMIQQQQDTLPPKGRCFEPLEFDTKDFLWSLVGTGFGTSTSTSTSTGITTDDGKTTSQVSTPTNNGQEVIVVDFDEEEEEILPSSMIVQKNDIEEKEEKNKENKSTSIGKEKSTMPPGRVSKPGPVVVPIVSSSTAMIESAPSVVEESCLRSRLFDTIEFQASDFYTDSLAARRSGGGSGSGGELSSKTLEIRKKKSTTSTSTSTISPLRMIKKEQMSQRKPALGECRLEFLLFMQHCTDIQEDEEMDSTGGGGIVEPWRKMLRQVVDLTAFSEEEEEEEEQEEEAVSTTPRPFSLTGIKRTLEYAVCILCEVKAWTGRMQKCKTCLNYYHTKCAKEYGGSGGEEGGGGGEIICWHCELGDMIDDSELTEQDKIHTINMLQTLRQDDEEEKGETVTTAQDQETTSTAPVTVLPGSMTRSMKRWKCFLDQSTLPLESSFQEITKEIAEELSSKEKREKYSMGFTTKEEFNAAITQVLDQFAELQERDRATTTTNSASNTEPSTPVATPVATPPPPQIIMSTVP